MSDHSSESQTTPDPTTEKGRARTRRRRDFTSMILAGIALVVSIVVAYTTLHNRASILHVQDGRRLGVISTCGINKALIAAGEEAIRGSGLLPGDRVVNGRFMPGPLTRQLGPNFPSYAERLAAGRLGADAYETKIVDAIIDTVRDQGSKTYPIARGKDGRLHLSCDASLKASGLK